MALSTLAEEQENFLRYAILIVDHTKQALQDLIELNLKNKHLTFEEFLNKNKHEIYHLCYDFQCCQCQTPPPKKKRILIPPQLELLFDKYNKLPSHKGKGHNDFCCSYAKVGITSQVLDLSLARCLLVNCCLDVFWFTCLTSQDQTLEQFLNSNKHIIYHLWKNNQNCCQCPSGFIFPCDRSIITEHEWKSMFSSRLSPCENDRKRMSTGSSSVCSVGATPGIATQNINLEIQRFILQKCSHISKAVHFLVEQRSLRFAHAPEAKISDSDFRLFLKDIEPHLLGISRVCGKETHVKNILRDLHLKPLSLNMLRKYEKLLHKNMEAINKNVNLQHRTTRQSIPRLVDKSSKIRRIEERVDALETSVAAITEEVKDLSKIIKDRSKRQRLIDQTSAEIETHEKDVPYVEIEALRHCIKLLESRNVVVLTGREGSGKSRNGLEILRQFKERHKDSDVFKLIGLHYVSDIVKCNVTSIVLFDDAFDKTCEQFANDKHILDHLYYYITLNKVKLIFTMRNTVRHACNRLLSTHRLFYDLLDIDLNSKKFKLTKVEKGKILTKYCDINKIKIFEKVGDKTNQSVFHEAGIDNKETIQTVSDQVSVFVNREMINEIIQTDPFLGFPECCRLFTEHRNNTMLDATIFKWPPHTLVKDIEKWRIEGKHDSVNGLKYVALICILSMGKSYDINEYYLGSNFKTYSLHEKNIDVKVCNEIFQECCNKNSEVYEHDIKYALDELVAGCYLVKKDGTYYFQHPALKDTVLVSYSKINTKAIIPLLSFDHMMDLVKLQNYIEQENEIFVRIQKKYYYDLALHFISLIWHTYDIRLMKCSTFAKNDIDFIHQLLICFNDKSETSLLLKSRNPVLIYYFPLCLLQNIGELDDNKLTANHTKDKLLISMVIEGQTITFIVDPSQSLQWAFQDKNERIIIWLAKNTDHSLLIFENLLYGYIIDTSFESIPLLLQNFDHDKFDMTTLLLHVCICCFNKENHIIDWIMDNIDNSLIDFDTMFGNELFFDIFDSEKYFNLILHIRNKVNRKLFDVSKAVQRWYIYRGTDIVQLVMQDDNKILDEEELIDILIDDDVIKGKYMRREYEEDNEQIVEQLLQTTGVKYYDLNKLVCVASKRGWLNVLELIFKHYADKSFHTDKVIEDALQQLGNGQHCEKTIRLIKFYVDYIDVNILMEKAINFGCHSIVEELLLLKKVDNISYHLDMTLEKLMSQRQSCYGTYYTSFTRCHETIIEQLLMATGVKYHDLNRLVCVASKRGWFNVLELIFKHDTNKLFHTDKVIEDVLQQLGNGVHCETTIRLITKYYVDYIDVNILMEKAINFECHSVVEELLLLKKVDNISYYLDMTLDKLMSQRQSCYCTYYTSFTRCHETIIEQLLLATGVKYHDLNRLVCVASKRGWFNVLELIIKHDTNKLFHTDKVIEDVLQQLGNGQHCEKTIRLITKYYVDYIDVNILMEKAIDVGCHSIVEGLLLKKVDNISYYLDITLDKLRHQQLSHGFKIFESDHGKILLLLLQKNNTKLVDLNSIMNDVCHIGHSPAIKWLLENKSSFSFDIRKVMNNACFRGDLELVDYLFQKYSDVDFDYKTAMIKACRHAQCNTLDVCKWLWKNIDRSMFDMKAALNNASKYDNTEIVKWILTDLDTELYDIDAAVFSVSEHGNEDTLQLLLNQSGIHMLDIQSALTLSCRNERSCLGVAKLLYRRANTLDLDMNAVLSEACKYYRIDFIQWIIATCDQNKTVTKTNYGNKNCINSLDKYHVDMDHAVTCILDMNTPEQKRDYVNETKTQLLMLILNKSDPSIIHIYKLLTEACKKDWLEIFHWILGRVDNACLNIGEIINFACRFGSFNIIKWSLRNIDMELVDVDNVMVESCGFGWLECVVLIWKHCDNYKLQAAMNEACTYGRLHIAEWLLQNVHYQLFNIPMLLKETGRNGWIKMFSSLLQHFHFDKSEMHIATIQALENNYLEIAELGITKVGKEGFDFSSLSETAYVGANKEGVVNFLLHNIDPKSIDIATIMTNACLFGWKDIAIFILDNDLGSRCDLSLAFNTACDNGELEIVQLLLDKVDPHIPTAVEKAMHSVAVKGWDEIALLLLDNFEHTRLDTRNALIEACRHGEIDVVQAILRKVNNNLLDVKAALNKACENHMHEELVLWVLDNIDQQKVDLKNVKTQAGRHKWRKVQFSIQDVDNDEVVQETETDYIINLE